MHWEKHAYRRSLSLAVDNLDKSSSFFFHESRYFLHLSQYGSGFIFKPI